MAVELGVDSIEHGHDIFPSASEKRDSVLRSLAASKSIWVPTLAAYYTMRSTRDVWDHASASFKAALALNISRVSFIVTPSQAHAAQPVLRTMLSEGISYAITLLP